VTSTEYLEKKEKEVRKEIKKRNLKEERKSNKKEKENSLKIDLENKEKPSAAFLNAVQNEDNDNEYYKTQKEQSKNLEENENELDSWVDDSIILKEVIEFENDTENNENAYNLKTRKRKYPNKMSGYIVLDINVDYEVKMNEKYKRKRKFDDDLDFVYVYVRRFNKKKYINNIKI
jgi:hypothetical protein